MTNHTWADAITIAAIIGNDTAAWATIIDGSTRYLMTIVASQGAGWDDANEIVQLAYTRGWERRNQFVRGGKMSADALKAWLAKIAVNAWRDHCRHDTRKIRILPHADLSRAQAVFYASQPGHELPPEDEHIRGEELTEAQEMLARIVARIPAPMRPRVRLLLEAQLDRSIRSDQAILNMKRVMAETGLGRSAAKSAMFRVRAALRHEAAMLQLEEAAS